MKAIILAGGLGTRLRDVVPNLPKPMALINGYPFLEVLINNLVKSEITDVILSVGYKYEVILEYFGSEYKGTSIKYVIEESPLGTGGALIKAMELFNADEEVFVLNGDTFIDLDYMEMKKGYGYSKADVGIALKPMADTYRYGRVALNEMNRISEFKEKGRHESGLINAGVYILRPSFFNAFDLPEKFSLENDCFVKYLDEINIYPYTVDGYFVDIGVPEDYKRAQIDLMSYIANSL
jgi:D-glycero-alpha-D-manno-heptose 1-phosphate guanylyltransferase